MCSEAYVPCGCGVNDLLLLHVGMDLPGWGSDPYLNPVRPIELG